MTKRFGFTLAEVLITLGIIGVVAAMTIPTLVKNYQKTIWVNQLKKDVSTIENGFRKMMADDEVQLIQDTTLYNLFQLSNGWNSIIFNEECGNMLDRENEEMVDKCIAQKNTLKKYFNIVNDTLEPKDENGKFISNEIRFFGYHYKYLDGTVETDESADCPKFYLADGSIISAYFFKSSNIEPNKRVAYIRIDVNGDKLPNQWGRDTFSFLLLNNGQLIPRFSKKALEAANEPYWNDSSAPYYAKCTNDSIGNGCAARIIENGWKMDY